MEDAKTETLDRLITNASSLYNDIQMRHDEDFRSCKEDKLNLVESSLFHTDAWSSAGYEAENEIASAIFSYNVGAVAHLADHIDRLSSKLTSASQPS